jgi:hypothetical protein
MTKLLASIGIRVALGLEPLALKTASSLDAADRFIVAEGN